jgi:PAS domain S-box-containing protein
VLADASPVTIAVADASGRYVFVNPAGCALCEMSAEEIYAGKSLELLHPEDRDRVLTRWAEYLAGSLPFETIHDTYRIVTPSGKMRWTLTQVTADVEEGTGRVLGFIIVSTDISEQKAAEEAKLAALESAEKAQRARASEAEMNKRNLQNFIDTICHETRNPLSGAMLTLELQVDMVTRLQEMVDSDNVLDRASLSSLLMEFADSVESLRLCVEHQRNVFNQVIELSRIESGKLLLQPTLFVVQDALEEVHQMHEAVCAKKRLQFRYSACADRIVVCADNIRFKQILINLVANAVKYTPVGGTIDLIMREPGVDALVFDVHDSGPGFTDSEREQLFHRFSQISRSKGDSLNSWNILHDNSAGLGLSICKVLIEMLQGSIDVTSQPGCGSTFSIRLPWKYERKAGIQYVPERYSVVGTRRYSAECSSCPPSKVLIVDDNTIASKALQRMLTRRGHAVEVAANGLDGVKSYEVFRPDVIFMDIEMPLMDGLEASRRIRNLEKEGGWPHVPIFAVSGYTRDETQNEAFAAGMNGYVPKPFRPADLDSIIARVRATT